LSVSQPKNSKSILILVTLCVAISIAAQVVAVARLAAPVAIAPATDATRKNLQRMRSSIESTRKRIDALQRRESSTMKSLSTFQRQRQQVRRIVQNLEGDLRALQDSASVLERAIRNTTSARQRVESAYADLAFAALSYDTEHPNITDAGAGADGGASTDARAAEHAGLGAGDAFIFEHITSEVTNHRTTMLGRQDSLSSEQQLLNNSFSEQERLLNERSAEGRRLANTIESRKKELDRIRGDKSLLLKELASKRASANTLTGMIRRQEAASRLKESRRQLEARRDRANKSNKNADAARGSEGSQPVPLRKGGFAANSLPWPTQSRSLIHGYGVYRNRETGTTLDNPGIDIRSPIGTRMACVAAGVVSSVTWLPGFGSLVIVDHKNGFRTVYANLTSVTVGIGSAVQSGSIVGSSGESIDGPTAHFEIWYGRERQNPLTYLR